jgi:four helix bundle protein
MEWAEVLRRRTFAFALRIVKFCRTLPTGIEGDIIRRQLLKAGTSVGANYRASCRGRSLREKRAKLGVALEEADETDYWLSLLETLDAGEPAERHRLLSESRELALFSSSLRASAPAKPAHSARRGSIKPS